MAIDAPSDIVMEVANAADPARAAAVAQRLNALAGAAGAGAADFAETLAATAPAASAPAAASGLSALDARARFAAAADASDEKATKVKTEFESVMLNSFVSEMLPKDASSIFGQGLAGDMWKSMLADQVSRQIAKSDALGIGKRLFATHSLAASDALEKAQRADAAAAASTAQMSANSLALPSAAEVDGGAVLFAGEKRS
jgi:Rod binding domain-containing protein